MFIINRVIQEERKILSELISTKNKEKRSENIRFSVWPPFCDFKEIFISQEEKYILIKFDTLVSSVKKLCSLINKK